MTIFDVGANNGNSTNNKNGDIIHAFEPTPYLLEKYLYPRQCESYIVIPKAVSNFDGVADFHIAGQRDWGCSSLNKFESNLHETWPGRTDFKVTQTIQIEVIRLDTYIKSTNITQVDWLHCDTQGNDLKVLQSFGEYINILKGGVVEGYKQNPLYCNIDNSVENIVCFLESNNFYIKNISSNDRHGNEVNVTFTKK